MDAPVRARPATAGKAMLWCRRIGWMAAIWAASVTAVASVSLALKLWLRP